MLRIVPSSWNLSFGTISMHMQPGKIVVLGTVLAGVSLLVGLLHSSLPMIFMQLVVSCIALFVFFCFGIFGLVAVSLAAIVITIGCLFMNPIGVCFLFGLVWFVLNRRTGLAQ